MSNDLTVIEPLEGEYIAAGEPEHVFTARDPISETMKQSIKRQQEALASTDRRSQLCRAAQRDRPTSLCGYAGHDDRAARSQSETL